MRRPFLFAVICAFLFAVCLRSMAASHRGDDPTPPELKAAVSSVPSPLSAPGSGVLNLALQVPSGYHIIGGEALSVQAKGPQGATFGTPRYPRGRKEEDQEVLRGKVLIEVPITLPAGESTRLKGSFLLDWQGCQDFGDKVCFLPTQDSFPFELPVGKQGQSQKPSPVTTPPVSPPAQGTPPAIATATLAKLREMGRFTGFKGPRDFQAWLRSAGTSQLQEGALARLFRKAIEGSLPLALALAFLFGILSSLTPCVYPVIPITVAYIGSRSEGRSRFHGFALSCAFVLGLAIVYAALGAFSATAGQAFGALTQTPWIGIPLAAVFFVLALSMFNLFEFKTPSALTNRIERTKQKSKGRGFSGAFLIGALSGLVASPCIGPLILLILGYISTTGSPLLGFVFMFTYALGMGLLFIVIGTFSGVLSALPKSGSWMDGVRILFGVLILGASFYFAGLYLSRNSFAAASLVALLIVILFLLFGAKRHFFAVRWRVAGILLSAAALAAVFLILPGHGKDKVPWRTDVEKALAEAASQGKPALLDFRADWCVACVELEDRTWPDPGVKRDLAGVIPIRLDMTRNTAENRAVLDRFDVKGLPTVLLLAPAGPPQKKGT